MQQEGDGLEASLAPRMEGHQGFNCTQLLIDWINNELVEERIIVKDLEEDLYDGQVLQKLFGKC